ncbi:SGNH/GDSL hydrolase family protein [Paenibacillus sp. DRB1-1]|uniref:SGNH/GDSL hydrolase family protein n=1 Tax=Paenibacillus sp. DRB1-1 TaxID=3422309 RepID=UPI003F9804BE
MNDSFLGLTQQDEMEGPKAPKDPVTRRSGFSVMYETMIEGTPRPDGSFAQEIYLEGRLADKAKYTGGVGDEDILELLTNCEGLRRLVHSIGITVKAHNPEVADVRFVYHNWGKTSKYESGTRLELICPADGSETMLVMEEYDWSLDDDVPGSFVFLFDRVGELATVNITFYLHDGFHVPEVSMEEPVDFDSQAYREMIAKSLLNKGNNKRLKAAIEKAKRGEEVTVAYIGGSITQGAGAVPIHENCYAYQSYTLFKKKFSKKGGESVQMVKAGVGGTPSELGIVRYDRDVLREGTVEPDIVVIEFAVNDAGDETKGNCYESLTLKALNASNKPAVILLFSVFVDDWNLQERLSPVGWNYDLPMVSVKDAVEEQFRLSKAGGNVISKRQFFFDIYHPSNAGHRVMADCLGWLFDIADEASPDQTDVDTSKPPVIGCDFAETKLLDRSNSGHIATINMGSFTETDTDLQMVEMDDHPYSSPQFPYNWMHHPENGASEFKITICSKRLILVFKDSGNSDFGCADIWVDEKYFKTADPHENNWTHCNAVILYNEQVSKEHTVVIRMAPGHETKRFTILGFGYI